MLSPVLRLLDEAGSLAAEDPTPAPGMSMMPGRVASVGYGPAYAGLPASSSVTRKALRAGRACVLAGLRRAFERHAEAEAARAALVS